MGIWAIALIGMFFTYLAWFVTATYYPPKGTEISRTSRKTYLHNVEISDPIREHGAKKKGELKIYDYEIKKVCFIRGIVTILFTWGIGSGAIYFSYLFKNSKSGGVVWWIVFSFIILSIIILSLWVTYEKPEGGRLPIFDVARGYLLLWFSFILGSCLLAILPSLPYGYDLHIWFTKSMPNVGILQAGLGTITLFIIGLAYRDQPIPPPEGVDEVPFQWRIWVTIMCVIGFIFSFILLGFANEHVVMKYLINI